MDHERKSNAGGVLARLSRLLGTFTKEKPPIVHSQSFPAPEAAASRTILGGAEARQKCKDDAAGPHVMSKANFSSLVPGKSVSEIDDLHVATIPEDA